MNFAVQNAGKPGRTRHRYRPQCGSALTRHANAVQTTSFSTGSNRTIPSSRWQKPKAFPLRERRKSLGLQNSPLEGRRRRSAAARHRQPDSRGPKHRQSFEMKSSVRQSERLSDTFQPSFRCCHWRPRYGKPVLNRCVWIPWNCAKRGCCKRRRKSNVSAVYPWRQVGGRPTSAPLNALC